MQPKTTLRQVVSSGKDLQAGRAINVVVVDIDHRQDMTHPKIVGDVEGSMLQGTALHMDRIANAAVLRDTMQSSTKQRIQDIQRSVTPTGTHMQFLQKDGGRASNLKRTLSRSSLAEIAFIMINTLQT